MTSPLFYREVTRTAGLRIETYYIAMFRYAGTTDGWGPRCNLDDMASRNIERASSSHATRSFTSKAAANAWLDHWEAQYAKMETMDGDGWSAEEREDAAKAKRDEESAVRFQPTEDAERAEEQACRDTDNRI